jgi:FkbM family methyltransferase
MAETRGGTMREALRAQLASLLEEDITAADERSATAYDRIAGARPVVLFGAGGIGRKTAAGLAELGSPPLAFADNNPALWGKRLGAVPVLSPAEAAERFGGDAAFVVSIWRGEGVDRMGDHVRQLRALGCDCVLPFGFLYWKHADRFLPHYALDLPRGVLEAREAVLHAFDLLSDDDSRREFVGQIRWRLHLDFDGLADPVSHPIYFPEDVCTYELEEVFVDCGAFVGDTLQQYFARPASECFRAIALEPDPQSFRRLSAFLDSAAAGVKDRVQALSCGVGSRAGSAFLDATGLPSASLAQQGTPIRVETLDRLLAEQRITYLKMDIEGIEPDAIEGARSVIVRDRPVLAICVYHRQDHLWLVANLIDSFGGDYDFFLRPHLLEVWDLVLYGIPAARRVAR